MRVFSLFIFLPFLFFSCKPSVTEKHQVTRSQLQGNWVCETLVKLGLRQWHVLGHQWLLVLYGVDL
jgi:hypothetical protein